MEAMDCMRQAPRGPQEQAPERTEGTTVYRPLPLTKNQPLPSGTAVFVRVGAACRSGLRRHEDPKHPGEGAA